MEKLHRQFSWQRMLVLGVTSAGVVGWMIWLQINRPPRTAEGLAPRVPTAAEWAPFAGPAFWSVVFVVVVAVVGTILTVRRARRLPEEEKDWEGPSPHADRKIPAEAWSPSPLMQAALRRTLAKQQQNVR